MTVAPCQDPDRSTAALMARLHIAEALKQYRWAYEAHGDMGGYAVGVLRDKEHNVVTGEQAPGKYFVHEVVAVEVNGRPYAAHIAACAPPTVREDIHEILCLRGKVKQMETQLQSIQNLSPLRGEEARDIRRSETFRKVVLPLLTFLLGAVAGLISSFI